MIINTEGIKATFQVDTLICSTQGLDMELHMRSKHGWSKQAYTEYLETYKQTMVGETEIPPIQYNSMIDDLIDIAKSFTGKTPGDFEHCHNWTDLEERLESKMRVRANKEKYKT